MNLRSPTIAGFACLATIAIATGADAAVRYVNVALATGAGTGTSWADAYRGAGGLQVALSASVAGDEIWVAAGTYLPSTIGARTASFTLKTGVAVYGGFAGTETALAQRNWRTNATILSGDLLGNDNGATNVTENAYHVVVGTGAAATAVLDGFTVKAGNSNGTSASFYDRGGGIIIYASGAPTVRNCVFSMNRCTFGGGAGYIFQAQGTFTDCEFNDNVGGSYGGAFDTNAVTSTFTRCRFQRNTAVRAGGVETFGGGNTTYVNCLFAGNQATGSGGGAAVWIGVSSSIVRAYNCTFASNTATSVAGGINTTSGGTLNAYNCVFWGNSGPGGATAANQVNAGGGTNLVQYSVVQGGFAGTGNAATDPLFVSAGTGNYALQAASPAVDAGSNTLVATLGMTADLAGAVRFVDIAAVADTGVGPAPVVDRGAFEVQRPPCAADLNADGRVDGADLGALLGNFGGAGVGDLDGNGLVDGADLGALLGVFGPCP
jgi:hypothetical protein